MGKRRERKEKKGEEQKKGEKKKRRKKESELSTEVLYGNLLRWHKVGVRGHGVHLAGRPPAGRPAG